MTNAPPLTDPRWEACTCDDDEVDLCPLEDWHRQLVRRAKYRAVQRLSAERRILATSKELREYQQIKGTSALHIARLAKAKLADPSP